MARPGRIVALDVNGDGRDDFAVTVPNAGAVAVVLQNADGTFAAPVYLTDVARPSDLTVIDANGDGRPDLLVTDLVTGMVVLYTNQTAAGASMPVFGDHTPFQTTTQSQGLRNVALGGDRLDPLNAPTTIIAGDFGTADRVDDLVMVNQSLHILSTLPGSGSGGFLAPTPTRTQFTGVPAERLTFDNVGALAHDDFDGDGYRDLAVIVGDTDQVWIYLDDSSGTFLPPDVISGLRIDVLPNPTGISVTDLTSPIGGRRDNIPDLLVSNADGDVLILAGTGDGHFVRVQSRLDGTPLDLSRLGGNEVQVLLANTGADNSARAVVQQGTVGDRTATVQRLTEQQLLAPGAVRQVQLDATGPVNLVVTSGVSNTVFVYRQDTNGVYVNVATYFVGNDPAAVEAADLNGDMIVDLAVANRGSNSVSVLIGQRDSQGMWSAQVMPPKPSGGVGPVGLQAMDVTGDGLPELLVTNAAGGSNGGGVESTLQNATNGLFRRMPLQQVPIPTVDKVAPPPTDGGGDPPPIKVITSPDGGLFTITPDGAVGSIGQVPPQSAVAFQPLTGTLVPGTQLIATIGAGGTVAAFLNIGAGGGFAAFTAAFTSVAMPDGFTLADFNSPSALSILETESGIFLYATTDGVEGVFVFRLDLNADPANPDNPGGILPDVVTGSGTGPADPTFNLTPTLTTTVTTVLPGNDPAPLVATPLFTILPESGVESALADAGFGPADAAVAFTTLLDFEEEGDSTDSGTEEEEPEATEVEEPSERLSAWESLLFGLSEWPAFLDEVPVWPGLLRAGDVLDILGLDDLADAVVDATGPGAAALLDALGLAPVTPPALREDVPSAADVPPTAVAAEVALEELAITAAPIRVAAAPTPDVRHDLGAEVLLPAAALLYRPLFGRAQRSAAHRTPAVREAAR
jgi:hypothetical protein